MTGRRTIVGSPPRRRQLEGVEAIERAIRHCEFWGCDTVSNASCAAYDPRSRKVPGMLREMAEWLPPDLDDLPVDELRARLAEVRP